MSAICDTSLGWIYRELVKEIKILELLSDAEFFSAFFMEISYFGIAASARQNLNLLVACLSHQSIYLVAISDHITHF